MARRRIGQEQLGIAEVRTHGGTSLDELAGLIDWMELDRVLAGISASAKGEAGWPPMALFRALLLATWHDLSDVRLAEALDDRASFRRFCGFATHEPTPERTAFVRFRAELVRRGLDRALFDAVTRQLDAHGASASISRDDQARWAWHRRRNSLHGYKAHVATDQDAGLIRGVEVTTANVHDAAEFGAILPDAPGATYGDSAYAGRRLRRPFVAYPPRQSRACGTACPIIKTNPRAEAAMDESALAELAVRSVIGEVTKSGASALLRWLRGKLTGTAGQEAAAEIAEQPKDASAQLALQAQLLKLLKTPGFAAELQARLGQVGATTTHGDQTAIGNPGAVNQVQGNNNCTGNR